MLLSFANGLYSFNRSSLRRRRLVQFGWNEQVGLSFSKRLKDVVVWRPYSNYAGVLMNLTNWFRICSAVSVLAALSTAAYANPVITNVVETGGDNTAPSIPAQWTGQTFTITATDNPLLGSVIGNSYTVGTFGNGAPVYVDRPHIFWEPESFFGGLLPSYLVGGEYIMPANNNRDNNPYQLDVTLSRPATVYLLIDNRLSDGNFLDPPTFDATHMQWVVNQGWLPKQTGTNLFANPSVPDDVTIALNGDPVNSGETFNSVYYKSFPAGTFSLFQADSPGINMYSVVVTVPEPATVFLLLTSTVAAATLLRRKR
jgi:hypothetical protein